MTWTLLAGLFASAFLAATVLPGSSEIVAVGLLAQGIDALAIWVVATVGNVLGAVLNWWLGGAALRFQDRPWFPVGREKLERVQAWFQRWGQLALLMSWVPGIGDAFTVAAGVLRIPLPVFVLLVAIAKGARYAVLLALAAGVGEATGWL